MSVRYEKESQFQSTLPQGERQLSECFFDCVGLFQSTLPQGERPLWRSIHCQNSLISIHAPTRGATMIPFTRSSPPRQFQSTLPQGERPSFLPFTNFCRMISIHAPTRGATVYDDVAPYAKEFQSTLPQGERRQSASRKSTPYQFQSTLPQGERHVLALLGFCVHDFNPRSHKGSDVNKAPSNHRHKRFQSTLPQGERRVGSPYTGRPRIFQSTLPQGERPGPNHLHVHIPGISIHAPTRGATQ